MASHATRVDAIQKTAVTVLVAMRSAAVSQLATAVVIAAHVAASIRILLEHCFDETHAVDPTAASSVVGTL